MVIRNSIMTNTAFFTFCNLKFFPLRKTQQENNLGYYRRRNTANRVSQEVLVGCLSQLRQDIPSRLSMRKSAIFLNETQLQAAGGFDCTLSRGEYDVTVIVLGAKRKLKKNSLRTQEAVVSSRVESLLQFREKEEAEPQQNVHIRLNIQDVLIVGI